MYGSRLNLGLCVPALLDQGVYRARLPKMLELGPVIARKDGSIAYPEGPTILPIMDYVTNYAPQDHLHDGFRDHLLPSSSIHGPSWLLKPSPGYKGVRYGFGPSLMVYACIVVF